MKEMSISVDLIWGEQDPWEPIEEAQHWAETLSCIRSLQVIPGAGHCPHDETPKAVNDALKRIVKEQAGELSPTTDD